MRLQTYGIGAIAGVLSGLATAIPPLGAFIPSVFFGLAYWVAYGKLTSEKLRGIRGFLLIVLSVVTFFISGVAALYSGNFVLDAGWWQNAFCGAMGSLIGGGCFLIGTCFIMIPPPTPILVALPIWTLIIAVLFPISVYISDSPEFGHPIDDIFLFTIAHSLVIGMLFSWPLTRTMTNNLEQVGSANPVHTSHSRDC